MHERSDNAWCLAPIALGLFCLAAVGHEAQAQAQAPAAPSTWPQDAWNPRAMPDDLVLPLPCGGSMAFRPVPTPMSPGALSDRQAALGWSNPDTDYSEFLHRSFIAGGFPGVTADAPRRYFIAKYEVTIDQYAAVTEADCAGLPSANGQLPKANVAWHEAVGFTVRLSSWLLKNAKQVLPNEGEALAFVRLPTEEEWEYAARGANKVSDLEFGGQTFPMPDGIQRYVWFQGTRSAGGAAHPVGRLDPNPLGLFDILGNVSEWTIEPYRLNKVGRPHGLAGSAIARGGDYLTSEQRIRSALRQEVPAFNATTGEPTRLPRIGFRPVLARVTTTDDSEVQAMQRAFADEASFNASAADNPVELLKLLRRDMSDEKTKAGLERIEATLQTANREIKEKDALVLRGVIKTAAQAARQIVVQRAVEEATVIFGQAQKDAVSIQEELIASQEKLAAAVRDDSLRNALRVQEKRMRDAAKSHEAIQTKMSEYAAKTSADTLASLKAEYLRIVTLGALHADQATLDSEGKVVAQEFEPQSRGGFLVAFTRVAVGHMKSAQAGKPPTSDQAEADLLASANALQRAPQRR
jgi:formylglycine-generating enzyme required for sulfatase activity